MFSNTTYEWTSWCARRMLPTAGSSSRTEEAAILEEAKAVSSVRGAASNGRSDAAASRGGRGRGRGNAGRARDAQPESPTRGEPDGATEGMGRLPSVITLDSQMDIVVSSEQSLFETCTLSVSCLYVPLRILYSSCVVLCPSVPMLILKTLHSRASLPVSLRVCSPLSAIAAPAEEPEAPLLAGVRLLALDSHEDSLAWSPPPGFIVMYDPDIAFIRQLEVCAACPIP